MSDINNEKEDNIRKLTELRSTLQVLGSVNPNMDEEVCKRLSAIKSSILDKIDKLVEEI